MFLLFGFNDNFHRFFEKNRACDAQRRLVSGPHVKALRFLQTLAERVYGFLEFPLKVIAQFNSAQEAILDVIWLSKSGPPSMGSHE
jgi:hypothetical protein